MKESIRVIFDQNVELLGEIDKAVYYFREQQYEKALGLLANSIDQVKFIIEEIITDREYFNLVSTDDLLEMLARILDAKKNKDFILLADLLELQLISLLVGVQEFIISKEEILFNEDNYKENINLLLEHGVNFPKELLEPVDTAKLLESGYRVEFTSCGLMTLAAENAGENFYFHSNSMVRSEAFLLAKHWYRNNIKRYIIYGFGMGYHLEELLKLDGTAEIEIYEADPNVMQLACAFAKLKNLLTNSRLKVISDPEFKQLKERKEAIGQDELFLLHYPSYKNIRKDEGRILLSEALPWLEEIATY